MWTFPDNIKKTGKYDPLALVPSIAVDDPRFWDLDPVASNGVPLTVGAVFQPYMIGTPSIRSQLPAENIQAYISSCAEAVRMRFCGFYIALPDSNTLYKATHHKQAER